MKVGIMQPYFFPYIGYFDLINRADQWIVFDVVKYKPKSWMNRNRIAHPTEGWQYVTVPVSRHIAEGRIMDVIVADPRAALERILGQLQHYRAARAPHFRATEGLVREAFSRTQGSSLRDLNVSSLAVVCEYLDIPFAPRTLSAMNLTLPEIEHAGQWAMEISAAVGADHYINPPGGKEIFDPGEFESRGIRLGFTPLLDFRYETGPYGFVERLSILDVAMWNEPSAIKEFLVQTAQRDELTVK